MSVGFRLKIGMQYITASCTGLIRLSVMSVLAELYERAAIGDILQVVQHDNVILELNHSEMIFLYKSES